ncbi:XRE family transcriptional regulator, partial [candidate division KSB1 bacterium]|nr:XRE family transcriptional regulator [candidate division KSB1 bacterium]NIR69905.1 XRE family transcriptional regulator [candidate division KSB1 bacterium]NIS25814.1 XRE family transcriptional regulator [candidate division KSB1 bacterium]NIT72689.1 XRE family transcriptional regulator [candidate division KSB1 bacterium]NIU26503.1 XRE family transcriptional regulator [candidate division KSB1 bacterium]
EAGAILGVNQQKVTALKNGRLKGFSIEHLFSFLEKLDKHICSFAELSGTSFRPKRIRISRPINC